MITKPINALTIFLLSISILLIGCSYSVQEQNEVLHQFTLQRLVKLRGDLDHYYDSVETLGSFQILKAKLGSDIEKTCFSRPTGKATCDMLINEANKLFSDPIEEATPEFKNTSFGVFIRTTEMQWKVAHENPDKFLTRNAALSSGLSSDLYDKAIEYYGLVDSALNELSAKQIAMGTARGYTLSGLPTPGCGTWMVLALLGFILYHIVSGVSAAKEREVAAASRRRRERDSERLMVIYVDVEGYPALVASLHAYAQVGKFSEAYERANSYIATLNQDLREIDSLDVPDKALVRNIKTSLRDILSDLRQKRDLLNAWANNGSSGREDQFQAPPPKSEPLAPILPPAEIIFALGHLNFTLEELPKLTKAMVKKKYLAISEIIHPDKHAKGTEEEKRHFTEQQGKLNKAKEDLEAFLVALNA